MKISHVRVTIDGVEYQPTSLPASPQFRVGDRVVVLATMPASRGGPTPGTVGVVHYCAGNDAVVVNYSDAGQTRRWLTFSDCSSETPRLCHLAKLAD